MNRHFLFIAIVRASSGLPTDLGDFCQCIKTEFSVSLRGSAVKSLTGWSARDLNFSGKGSCAISKNFERVRFLFSLYSGDYEKKSVN